MTSAVLMALFLTAESAYDLQILVMKVNATSENMELRLNVLH